MSTVSHTRYPVNTVNKSLKGFIVLLISNIKKFCLFIIDMLLSDPFCHISVHTSSVYCDNRWQMPPCQLVHLHNFGFRKAMTHHSIVWLYSSMNVVVCLLRLVIWVVYHLYQKICPLWYIQFLRWDHVEGSTFIWLLQEISISTVWMPKWTSFLYNWFWLQLTTISFLSVSSCQACAASRNVLSPPPLSHIVFFPPFFWQIMYLLKSFSIEDWLVFLVFIEGNSISGSLFKSCWSIADSIDLQQKRI